MATTKEKKMFEELDLVGTAEIATMIGWTTEKVGSYHKRGIRRFPAPIGTIGGKPTWTRSDVKAWIDTEGI
jgi:predicted DNA-binding transcriptional regulator AlpA